MHSSPLHADITKHAIKIEYQLAVKNEIMFECYSLGQQYKQSYYIGEAVRYYGSRSLKY